MTKSVCLHYNFIHTDVRETVKRNSTDLERIPERGRGGTEGQKEVLRLEGPCAEDSEPVSESRARFGRSICAARRLQKQREAV